MRVSSSCFSFRMDGLAGLTASTSTSGWTRVKGPLFLAHAAAGYTVDSMNMLSVRPLYFHLNLKLWV